MHFQCGPEPEYVASSNRLPDGRRVGVFLRDDKTTADLFITQDHHQPELWIRLATGSPAEMEQQSAEIVRVFQLLRVTMPPFDSPTKGGNSV